MEKINVSEEGVQLLQKEQKNNLIQKMETNGLKNYEKIFNSLHNLKQNVFNKNKLGEIIFYNYENLNLTILLNNFDLTRFLVVIGADVNLQDENGRTPLFVATSINNPEMVQLLLDNGADINLQNKNGITPLNFAVIKKNLKMVQLLLDKGANVSIQNELITLISEIFYNKEEDDFSEFDNSIPEVADDNLQDENDRNSLGKSDWFIDLIFRRKLILKMQDSFKMAKILINNAADVNDQKKSELIYLIYEKLHNDAKNDKFDTKNIFLDSVKGYDLGDINTILKLRENIQIKLAFKDSNGHEIKNNPEIVQLLLDKGADVNLQNKNGDIPLITAIKNNDLKMVQLLLDNGADINLQNKNVDIPLITAIKNNDLKMVQLLLDKGADVNLQNKNGLIPLDYAMDRNNKELVQFLIDNGAGVNIKDWFGCTPLHNAIIKDNLKMVQFLIDKGADVNIQDWFGFTPLITAIKNNDLKMFQFLIDNGAGVNIQDWFGCTPLHNAIIKDNLKMVQLLLDKGADVKFHNKNGDAILITAIKNNDLKMFQLLLDNGAGVNIRDENGHTPLNYAIYGNNKELFQLLIDKGANVNIQNKNGHTPLITSIDRNNKELFQLLLDNGADVNIQDKNGHTPLITSIDRNNKELFQLLLDNGADVNIQDKNGHTPLSVAKYLNNQEIVQLLIAKGAKLIVNEISNDNNAVSDNKNPVGSKKSNNENQRYDVLPDGSCLFWTAATSYLLPVRNNNDEFRARFIKLFGEQELQNLLYVQNLLQQFNLENNRDLNQLWYQNQTANNLVTNVFRNRVVDYIQSNLNMITNRGSELTFRNLIQENNEIDNNYLDRMREPSTWGGTPEILATTNMLNANISVNNDIPYQPVNQNSNNTINIFHVNGNHYNFGLENQIPQTDAEYKKSTGGGCLTEEDNDIENNSSSLNFPQLKKDEYHFINQKTEQNSLKNDENLNIYLIKNENKIINKYNSLSKEQKQQKLNEINQHYQNLSENNKKVFIDKLKTIGSAALGAGISGVGTKITVGGSTSTTIGAEATGEAIEMTPLLSEGGLTAAETLSVAEGTAVVASEGAVIGTEAGAAAALAPETLGLSLVIGGLVITGTALIWWLNHDNNDRPEAVKNESHNQYNEVEKYYQFLSHDQLKLDININTWDKIKQIYQANKDNYEGFKEQIKATITSFHKEDHSGWGGSITDEDTNTLINIIYSHFQEINTHFTNNPNHGWKIVTNTIGSYFIIEEE
ncbi:ankyrin repeat domain-containing protein [Spiroplasma poulsonii]|uniref:ankyrin repeat domain-containing protein n=1 Tax=Spiroplasma poulsonii TaxID=2138 RepID=UPI001F4C5887|nr:ankyrin repeat domain-containing protein [Spiroplasma poulsonii]UNF62747.1 ankyrin repeat domain-containing protein [Spiroplasma poulsonii]